MKSGKRRWVRAENPTGVCGHVGHMTIDELRQRSMGEDFDATCPSCGMFHLTREEIDEVNALKQTESTHFARLRQEAEEK